MWVNFLSFKIVCSLTIFPAGIGNDAKKEFKNFDIDISNKTSFEVTNILWDMIEAANPNDWIFVYAAYIIWLISFYFVRIVYIVYYIL